MMPTTCRWLLPLVLFAPSTALATPLTVIANDSAVKDKVLPGVTVEVRRAADAPAEWAGLTDARGQASFDLPPGSYLVTLIADDYVQLEADVVQVGQRAQAVTITLTEKLGGPDDQRRQRLQIVLNWGADEERHVRDADAHLLCGCGLEHVYFGDKEHETEEHQAELDVDDMDWGGPETITVLDGPAGEYVYWVYDFSAVAEQGVRLGASEVVVRVVSGDALLGQYRIPADHPGRIWLPFKHVALDAGGEARVVPFSVAELAEGAAGRLPAADAWPAGTSPTEGESCDGGCDCTSTAMVLLVGVLVVVLFRLIRWRSKSAR